MRALVRGLSIVVMIVTSGAVAACRDAVATPSADEAQVCTAVQDMVDHLVADRNPAAMASLGQLQAAVESTANERIAQAGNDFFREAFGLVDYSELTMDQVRALALSYEASMAGSLEVIIDECDQVGATIERLPGQ